MQMQTVGNRLASQRKAVMNRLRAGPRDVPALAGPITHASGMFIQPFLFQRETILLDQRFEPDSFLASVEEYRVTACFLVPTMINMLVVHPRIKDYDLSSLKQVRSGEKPSRRSLSCARAMRLRMSS
jgi:acyl-CoA synthetase (AMP-forming)/AMP-acid ligase II